jgi:peptide/nickel transport system permease protein
LYLEDPTQIVPLGIFQRGEPYKLWGLIPAERHFIGIKASRTELAAGVHATFYFLGADEYGRDIFSRLVYGARISLSVGLVAIAVTFLLGVTIGGISGYWGGGVDTLIQRVIEIVNAFPQIPLWLAFGYALPADWPPLFTYFAITIVLSLLGWTGLARVVRGKILALREEDYATAARLLGASHVRILFRHLLPGFTSHIIVVLTMSVPTMILGETSLSFLGLGLRAPIVSWGVMLNDCLRNGIQPVANHPWLLMPVVFIVLTVLCFNFLGDGLRDAADPYAER